MFMRTRIKNIKIAFLGLITLLCVASCQKIIQYEKYDIVTGTIYINQANLTDAVFYNTLPDKDTTVNVTFEAAIADQPSAYNHTVTFKVDTTKLAAYITLHGNAKLLPASNYQVVKTVCHWTAGTALSESGNIKLLHTSALSIEGNYVLPVIIDNIDNRTDALRKGQVLYLVFTKAPVAKNFKIVSSTSDDGTNVIANVLAGNTALYWKSSLNSTPPQTFVVNMNGLFPISAINYNCGPDYTSQSRGAPKNIEIDLSTDGTTWVTAGNYVGLAVSTLQTMSFSLTTAQYFRIIITTTNYTGTSSSYKYLEMSNLSVNYPLQ